MRNVQVAGYYDLRGMGERGSVSGGEIFMRGVNRKSGQRVS